MSVDHTSEWKFPAEKDGWYRAHNCIRADMDALKRMMTAYINQLQAGIPLSASQQKAAMDYFTVFFTFVHHHHDSEEKIAMPYMVTRGADIPSRVADDHIYLMAELDKQNEMLTKAFEAPETGIVLKTLVEIKGKFIKMDEEMREHFKEEETVLLPLMRKIMPPADCQKNIVGPIVRSLSAQENGTYFDKFEGPHEMSDFAKQEGIPFFIVWLLKFFVRKYRKNVKEPFEKAVAEAEAVTPPATAA